jgi:hypothetical protein
MTCKIVKSSSSLLLLSITHSHSHTVLETMECARTSSPPAVATLGIPSASVITCHGYDDDQEDRERARQRERWRSPLRIHMIVIRYCCWLRCQNDHAKYTCPKCNTCYCSLGCYKVWMKQAIESMVGNQS